MLFQQDAIPKLCYSQSTQFPVHAIPSLRYPHPYQWNNFSPEEATNHDEKAARNVLRRMHHVNDITPRDFVEVCVDMKQQGVGGYDSWGARPEPFHQIPANREYNWGFTLVPVRSGSQATEATKYDYR